MAKPPSVRLNITSQYLGSFVTLGVTLILTPIMVKYLGATIYGIWVTIHLIVFYINFIDLGLYNAIVKYIAEYHAKDDHQEVNRIVQSSLSVYMIIGGAAAVISVAAASFGEFVFQIPPAHIPDFKMCLILFGVELLIAFPASVYNAVLEGHQRFDILNLTAIAFQIAGALVTVALVLSGFGLKALIIVEIIFSILGVLVDYTIVKFVLPHIAVKPAYYKQSLKQLFGFSLLAFLLDLFEEGGAEVETFVIPILFPVALLTPYKIAVMFASIFIFVVQPIVDVLFPLSSSLQAQENRMELRRYATNGTKAASAISLPIFLVFIFFGEPLIAAMFPEEHVGLSYRLLLIMSCSYYSTCLLLCPISLLVGMGKMKKLVYFSIIEGVAILLITVPLYGKLGIYGIAVGFAAANILTNACFILPHVTRTLQIKAVQFISHALFKPLISAAGVAVALAVYKQMFDARSLPAIAVGCTVATALYAALFLFFSSSRSEREAILKHSTVYILNMKSFLRKIKNA